MSFKRKNFITKMQVLKSNFDKYFGRYRWKFPYFVWEFVYLQLLAEYIGQIN
ncbi:hypothetical protein [Chryseobacterium sp. EZn1]|uniref:hypothetical protein n=1 Tax=Chryseobacterium cupriresistens TaxID=3366770 RepID=UPI003984C85C